MININKILHGKRKCDPLSENLTLSATIQFKYHYVPRSRHMQKKHWSILSYMTCGPMPCEDSLSFCDCRGQNKYGIACVFLWQATWSDKVSCQRLYYHWDSWTWLVSQANKQYPTMDWHSKALPLKHISLSSKHAYSTFEHVLLWQVHNSLAALQLVHLAPCRS